MNKLFIPLITLCSLFSGLQASAQTLLHYWNFNTTSSYQAHLTPSFSIVSGAAIDTFMLPTAPNGSGVDVTGGTGQDFNVNNHNARNGDASGNHLRFNNPLFGTLRFSLPTTGYENVVLKYAAMRSNSGAYFQLVHYTTDGVNYTFFDTIKPVVAPALYTLDFSGIAAAGNNPDFKVRITFAQGGGGTAGNNRFDNVTLEGTSISSNDNTAPSVVFAPINNAISVDPSVKPTLTFNEDIRLAGNIGLNDNNVDTLLELRVNDAAGIEIAFDASINGNVITVTPGSTLANNQQYYLALKANRITDLAGNAISSTQSVTFTTIAVQTIFQPGDLVPVAYRMSATAVDDEIALLTLVDILPGTVINITDGKYTDNAVAQCSGGLTWTAPAQGIDRLSIITLKNDDPSVSVGELAGSKFGLSSGGDQFILYTGSNTNPSYITALSSNNWVSANTSCTGSESKRPVALTDGVSSIQLSAAAVSGNTANAYYDGPQSGFPQDIRAAVFDPANWVGAAANTAAQAWPVWDFSFDTSSAGLSFETNAVTVTEQDANVKVNINITPFARENGKVVIKVTEGAGITAADYTTTPALTGDSLVLEIKRNDTLVSFTVNITNDSLEEQLEIVSFNIGVQGARLLPGATPTFSLSIAGNDTVISSVTELMVNGKQVMMYPNPSTAGTVFFNKALSAQVFDLTGKLLLQSTKTNQLDVRSLAKGLYLVRIEGVMTRKLVIE